MNTWQALILGLLQGVTEFLPVSSSGHLALAQNWFGIQEPLLSFDVFLHGMSLIAILVFFFQEIRQLNFKQYFLIGIATIPAVIVGLLFKDTLELALQVPLLIGVALLITGIDNLFSHRLLQKSPKEETEITPQKALIIGLFQSLALIPGISRSGTTLLASLGQKLGKKQAFTFTFLLAIPAIMGALLLQGIDIIRDGATMPHWSLFVIGGISTLFASLASLTVFKKLINKSQFTVFGIYCLALGLIVIFSQLT